MKNQSNEISVEQMKRLLIGKDPKPNERRSEKPVDAHPESLTDPQTNPKDAA